MLCRHVMIATWYLRYYFNHDTRGLYMGVRYYCRGYDELSGIG